MPSELAFGYRSRQPIIRCLDGSLCRNWRLRRAGARKPVSALEIRWAMANRLAKITAHLDTLDVDELDLRLVLYQRATGRLWMGAASQRG